MLVDLVFWQNVQVEAHTLCLIQDVPLQSGYENFVKTTFTNFENLLHLVAPIIFFLNLGVVENESFPPENNFL